MRFPGPPLVVSLRLLAAIVIFAAIAPGILMTAPAVAAQLASEWQLKPGQVAGCSQRSWGR